MTLCTACLGAGIVDRSSCRACGRTGVIDERDAWKLRAVEIELLLRDALGQVRDVDAPPGVKSEIHGIVDAALAKLK